MHPDVALSMNKLAGLLQARGPEHYTEAETLYRVSLSIERTLHKEVNGVHPSVAIGMSNLAGLLNAWGQERFKAAEALCHKSMSIEQTFHKEVNGMYPDVATRLNHSARLLQASGQELSTESKYLYLGSFLILRIIQTKTTLKGAHPEQDSS